MASVAGEAMALRGDVLPTEGDIYRHYLQMLSSKVASGEWHCRTPLSTKVKSVTEDVAQVWDKTPIPHNLEGREGERRVMAVITKVRDLDKVVKTRRGEGFGSILHQLFDVARCKCLEECQCEPGDQVPKSWQEFLKDQRHERKLQGVLSDKKLSLRGAAVRKEEDNKEEEEFNIKVEKTEEQARKKLKQEDKNKTESDLMFSKVSMEESEEEGESGSSDEEWKGSDPKRKKEQH